MNALQMAAIVMLAVPVAARPAPDERAQLTQLASMRVFFGHQSVGENLVAGLAELQASHPEAGLRLVQTRDAADLGARGFAHAYVGRNTDPRSKLRDFEQILDGGVGEQVDVAMLKFCYVDFDEQTDAAALFADYRTTLARLQARFPRVRFVHVTVPLAAVHSGPRGLVRRALGRDLGVAANARRHAFNQLLRHAYAGQPLFDLAALEATRPDGTENTFAFEGARVPALVRDYTDDGGHLNRTARLRFARELVATLTSAGAR